LSKQTLQAILRNYQKSSQATAAKIEEAVKIYQPAEAKARVEKLKAHQDEERKNAISAIQEEQEKARAAVAEWARLDGSKITDDAKLLEYGGVTPQQFSELAKKYRDNGTMCQVLRNYGEKHNAQLRKESREVFPAGLYALDQIQTVEDRTREAEHSAKSALSIVNMIDGGFLGGPNSQLVESAINEFLND